MELRAGLSLVNTFFLSIQEVAGGRVVDVNIYFLEDVSG